MDRRVHRATTIRPLGLAFTLLVLSVSSSFFGMAYSSSSQPLASDPLGHFEGSGPTAQISWTGDGQKIGNPSFENGLLAPWITTSYNAGNQSGVQVTSPGYGDGHSARILLYSANLSIGSNLNLGYDLSQSQVGFNSAVRFRAAVLVQSMTGVSPLDKVEVTLTLSTSTGATRTIHYIFDGPSLSFKPVVYDNANTGNYTSTTCCQIIFGQAPAVGTLLSVDSKIKFLATPPAPSPNSTGTWFPPETVVYDADNSGTFSPGDLVIAGTRPAFGTNLSVDSKIKFVDTPPARTPNAPGTVLQGNTASDLYVPAPNSGVVGQWLTIDRNVSIDAAGFSDSSILDSVQQVRLSSLAESFAKPNHDPHVRYVDGGNNGVWVNGDTIVFDPDADGAYNQTTDTILAPVGAFVTPGTPLKDDPLIRFVDTDRDGIWNNNEPVVYDQNNDGLYTFGEPTLSGTQPVYGTPLTTKVVESTSALFDQVELYAASGNSNWIHNGGFETGLGGWGYTTTTPPTWTSSFLTPLAGTTSASGTVTGSFGEMAQSIDAHPQISASTVFKASANITRMDGASAGDYVDIWVGLVDARGSAVSIYYYFKTGDGSIPSNNTDTVYHKVSGFGTVHRWLSLSVPLLQEEAYFNSPLRGYAAPYSVELVVAEVAAGGGAATTSSLLDEFSILSPGYSGSASSYFYANNGVNTTYLYTAQNVPQGSLSFQVPAYEQVLNLTAPDGTAVAGSTYLIQPSASLITVTAQPAAFFGHPPMGTWKLYTSSTNVASNVFAQDPATLATLATVEAGSVVNLVSQGKDPIGRTLPSASANITLWNPSGTVVGTWTGTTNNMGWWNASGVTVPPNGGVAGTYNLQVTLSSSSGYTGVKTLQLPLVNIVTLSMNLTSGTIIQDTSVTISGSVTDSRTGNARQGVNVTLSYCEAGSSSCAAGSSSWITITQLTTDSSGRYSYSWTPPQGQYNLRTSVGDSQTQSAQTTPMQLIVNPPSNQQGNDLLTWLFVGIAAGAVAVVLASLFIYRRRRSQTQQPRSTD